MGKRLRFGFLSFGSLYFVLAVLAMMSESLQQAVGPLLRPMSNLVQPIYDVFLLHDDDPRVIYPVILSSLLWGLLGGAVAVLIGGLYTLLRQRYR